MSRKLNESSAEDEAMPLDYSFKKMVSLKDLKGEKPREGRVGKTPIRGPSSRFITKSVWLNNNNLVSMESVDVFVNSVLENPSALGWIDFSFNSIKEVDNALLSFENLRIIYLHGNQIDELDSVIRLKRLKNLKRLTLHGNPVSFEPGYRSYVVQFLPQLMNLDFAPVLKEEKLYPPPPGALKKYAGLLSP